MERTYSGYIADIERVLSDQSNSEKVPARSLRRLAAASAALGTRGLIVAANIR